MGFSFDAQKYDFPSSRKVVFGRKGMVCTSQPLAAQAGLDIIKKGGNAIDAAIATAACLTVVEPTSNGIGSDAFALVWTNGKLHGLNGSGPAPQGIDVNAIREKNSGQMPKFGWDAVTVPGAVSAWAELSQKFGKLPLTQVLQPAIDYAAEGHAVSPGTAGGWHRAHQVYSKEFQDECLQNWFTTFAPDGKTPKPGCLVKLPDHAATLREIAATNGESFYRGNLADKIDAFAKATGGALRKEDLAAFKAQWVEPISVDYKGYTVHEIPPNGQGIVALMALNILSEMEINGFGVADTLHKQIEAMKLAFIDGHHHIADDKHMQVTVKQLLSKEYAAKRRALIGNEAMLPKAGDPTSSGTVYLCTADGDGNMVSFIQSNYMGFGSGVVVPGTGIALQNRGNNFSLDPQSPNCIAPGKKPYHTIIPGFLSKDGHAVGPFGVMGGFMQPQGHVQVIMNTVDFGMNPQEALDAPRWQWTGEKKIDVEHHFGSSVSEQLLRRGHTVTVPPEATAFGRGQIIWRSHDGVLAGATEPRSDGNVAAW